VVVSRTGWLETLDRFAENMESASAVLMYGSIAYLEGRSFVSYHGIEERETTALTFILYPSLHAWLA
jgi:hypothetical protein